MNAVRHGVESPLGADAAERAEFAAQIISDNGGHIANPANMANHDASAASNDGLRFDNANHADCTEGWRPPVGRKAPWGL